MNLEHIEAFFDFLGHKKGTEIRIISKGEVKSLCVKNWQDFKKICEEQNGLGNIYAGINERSGGGKSDDDVKFITCIGHDLDCHNEQSNLEVAKEVALKIRKDCLALGYAEPLILCSGYGYWVLHRVEPIQNIPENIERIKIFGLKTKEHYEQPGVDFDTKVYNPSRIARIPGTLNLRTDKPVLSYCLNNPIYTADFKLQKAILSINLPNYTNFVSVEIPKDGCAFMNYCFSNYLPIGERHSIVSRNMSLYIHNKENVNELKKAYIAAQKGKQNELDSWLKSIDKNPGKKFPFSCGELIKYQKKNSIPIQCENCNLFKEFNKKIIQPKGWGRVLTISQIAKDYNIETCLGCNEPYNFLDSYGSFKCNKCGDHGGLKKLLTKAMLRKLEATQ